MRIKLLSYNVGLIDIVIFGRTVFEFAKFTRRRASVIAGYLLSTDADVLCIQELFHQDDFNVVVRELLPIYPFVYRSERRTFRYLGSGLAMFSRFPILGYEQYSFSDQLWDDNIFSPKCFQIGELQVSPNFVVTLANVHTTAGGAFRHPESGSANIVRQRQICQLSDTVARVGNPKAIICGDLNCGPTVSPDNFQYVLNRGYVDPVVECAKACTFVTWDPNSTLNRSSPHKSSPPQRIDHILLSDALHGYVETDAYIKLLDSADLMDTASGVAYTPSDHCAVMWVMGTLRKHAPAA